MDEGTGIVAIVAIICIYKFLRFAVERGTAHKFQGAQAFSGPAQDKLAERIDRIEKRMANIETIILEREKKSEFERAL